MELNKQEFEDIKKELSGEIKKQNSLENIIQLATLEYYYYQLKENIVEISEESSKINEEGEAKLINIYDNISKVVKGEYEYTAEDIEELKWIGEESQVAEISEKAKAKQQPVKEFWYECLETCLEDSIQDKDAPVLRLLESIELKLNNGTYEDFSIMFTFAENDYFEEKVITKRFIQKKEELIKTDCSPITWKEGKDLTKKTIKKKQKNKKTKETRKVTKEVDDKSFFTFFTSLEKTEQNQDDDDFLDKLDEHDHIAEVIINEVIPFSIENYFTNEGIFDGLAEGADEDFEDQDDDASDDDDDESNERSKSKERKKSKGKLGKHKKSDHSDKQDKAQEKPECKQQ